MRSLQDARAEHIASARHKLKELISVLRHERTLLFESQNWASGCKLRGIFTLALVHGVQVYCKFQGRLLQATDLSQPLSAPFHFFQVITATLLANVNLHRFGSM